jgi:hypothetical protein
MDRDMDDIAKKRDVWKLRLVFSLILVVYLISSSNAIAHSPPLPQFNPTSSNEIKDITIGDTAFAIPEKYFTLVKGRNMDERFVPISAYSVTVQVGFPRLASVIEYTRPFQEKYEVNSVVARVENAQWKMKAYRPFTEKEKQEELEKAEKERLRREQSLIRHRRQEEMELRAQGIEPNFSPLRPVTSLDIPEGYLLDTLENFVVDVEIYDLSEWEKFCKNVANKRRWFSAKYFKCNEKSFSIGDITTYWEPIDPSFPPPPPAKGRLRNETYKAHICDDIYIMYKLPVEVDNSEEIKQQLYNLVKSFVVE